MDSGYKKKEYWFSFEIPTTILKDFLLCRQFPCMHVAYLPFASIVIISNFNNFINNFEIFRTKKNILFDIFVQVNMFKGSEYETLKVREQVKITREFLRIT